MKKNAITTIFYILVFFYANNLFAQSVVVQGIVKNNTGQPVPGLTVSIFNPSYGRSNSVITDERGFYIFYNIPVAQGVSYIEAYWGSGIIYRSPIQINGPLVWNIDIR